MKTSLPSTFSARGMVTTVLGSVPYQELGITDGHNHVWIDRVAGADPAAPVLDRFDALCAELTDYRTTGGRSLLDCQPGGCGRNGRQLIRLARESGVNLIACTGFHRKKYYPPDHWLFAASEEQAARYFTTELSVSLEETGDQPEKARAGFIKLALEASWSETPQTLLLGVAGAASQTGAMLEIHTEKGALAEESVQFFAGHGVAPDRLVLCHMDKRPDFALHAGLARLGALLEYDTFYRPKYAPETRLWPLLLRMIEAGLDGAIVLATDMAEVEMYKTIGGGPGLASLPGEIRSRLIRLGISQNSIQKMLGRNIARRLAGIS